MSAFPRLATVSAALAYARPEERHWLATELLELAVPPDATPASGSFAQIRTWLSRRSARGAERLAEAALVEVVRRWMQVPDELKATALAVGRGRWARAVKAVGQDAAAARGIAALSLETLDPSLIPCLVEVLSTPALQTGMYVERALVELVRRATGIEPELLAGPGGRAGAVADTAEAPADRATSAGAAALEAAVVEAVATFPTHRARGAIWCALMLLDRSAAHRPNSAVAQWLKDKDQPSLPALRGVIRWSAKPLARLRAWEWLPLEHLATAAADRLTRAQSLLEHELVLERHHFVLHPARALRLRGLGGRGPANQARASEARASVLPPPGMLEQLSREARIGLSRFAAALRLGVEGTRQALGPLLADPDPAVRFAACRCTTLRGLSDYCFDPDTRVARSAVLALSMVGVPEVRRRSPASEPSAGRLHQLLMASPHASVRRLAIDEARRSAWDEPGFVAGRLEARRMLAADRIGFLRLLRERWGQARPDVRPGLVMLVRWLGLQDDFKDELEQLVRAGLARVETEAAEEHAAAARAVATAVAALGHTDIPPYALLEEAARRAEDRVRANAVEAIGRSRGGAAAASSDSTRAELLADLKDDPHHRVRANALRAMITPHDAVDLTARSTALDGLAAMLHDERGLHRLAGVWLAERTLIRDGRARAGPRWPELASRLVEIAGSDEIEPVRRRARSFVARLRDELRRGPGSRKVRGEAPMAEVAS